MDIPLLNDYKKGFVKRRLMQTLFGGMRLFGSCPCRVALLQLAVFLVPFLLAIPATLALDHHPTQSNQGGRTVVLAVVLCSYGLAIFAYSFGLQALAKYLSWRTSNTTVANDAGTEGDEAGKRAQFVDRLFRQEDQVEFKGCCTWSVWSYVLLTPQKKSWPCLVIHSALAALFMAAALVFLEPNCIAASAPWEPQGIVVWTLVVAGWVTSLLAFNALIVSCPPEPAAFKALPSVSLDPLTRASHATLAFVPFWVSSVSAVGSPALLALAVKVSQIIYALLPILWWIGVLPPLDCLAWWALEQAQVFLLGGTPTYTLTRAALGFVLSLITPTILIVLNSVLELRWHTMVVVSCASGYLFSTDLVGFLQGLPATMLKLARDDGPPAKGPERYSLSSRPKASTRQSKAKLLQSGSGTTTKTGVVGPSSACSPVHTFTMHAILFCLMVLILILVPTFNNGSQGSTPIYEGADNSSSSNISNDTKALDNNTSSTLAEPQSTSAAEDIIGWMVVAIWASSRTWTELQTVFCFFGLLKSPVYSEKPEQGPGTGPVLWANMLLRLAPGVLLSYHLRCFEEAELTGIAWYVILATVKTARWNWQDPDCALLEAASLQILLASLQKMDCCWPQFMASRPVQLLAASLIRDRLVQTKDKLYLVVALMVSSVEDRPSRRPYYSCLFQANLLLLLPLTMASVVASSLLSAPILTLFTLPIFFVSFPRPSGFWPPPSLDDDDDDGGKREASRPPPESDEGALYYRQLCRPLVEGIHRSFLAGRLGTLHPGRTHLLCRHGDRTAWVRVLEKGNGYVVYQLKGLELQETSCHNLEATRVDEVFSGAFAGLGGDGTPPPIRGHLEVAPPGGIRQLLRRTFRFSPLGLNLFWSHTVTPLTRVGVTMYSSSSSVLTGVLDSPDTLRSVARLFTKALVWYLVKHQDKTTVNLEPHQDPMMMREPADLEETRNLSKADPESSRKKDADRPVIEPSSSPEEDSNAAQPKNITRPPTGASNKPFDGDHPPGHLTDSRPLSSSIEAVNLNSWPSSSSSSNDDGGGDASQEVKDRLASALRSSAAWVRRVPPTRGRRRHPSADDDTSSSLSSSCKTEQADAALRSMRWPLKKDSRGLRGTSGGGRADQDEPSHRTVVRRLPPLDPGAGDNFNLPRPQECWGRAVDGTPGWTTMPATVVQPRNQTTSLLFPNKFYRRCLNLRQLRLPDEDPQAVVRHCQTFDKCLRAVFGVAAASADMAGLESSAVAKGPSMLVRAFEEPAALAGAAANLDPDQGDLLELDLAASALRCAVKIAIDRAVMFEPEISADNDDEEQPEAVNDDLYKSIRELDDKWFLGQDTGPGWVQSVLDQKPHLFSLTFSAATAAADEDDGNPFRRRRSAPGCPCRSKLLALRRCSVNVGKLNPEVVRSLWASLAWELLYLTNDDDERFSIQAEERLLRNLTVEVADPPLGYPAFISRPITLWSI